MIMTTIKISSLFLKHYLCYHHRRRITITVNITFILINNTIITIVIVINVTAILNNTVITL